MPFPRPAPVEVSLISLVGANAVQHAFVIVHRLLPPSLDLSQHLSRTVMSATRADSILATREDFWLRRRLLQVPIPHTESAGLRLDQHLVARIHEESSKVFDLRELGQVSTRTNYVKPMMDRTFYCQIPVLSAEFLGAPRARRATRILCSVSVSPNRRAFSAII